MPGADAKLVAQIMGSIADRVVHEFAEPFTFPCHHQRILKPYDYYAFGQACWLLPYSLLLHRDTWATDKRLFAPWCIG